MVLQGYPTGCRFGFLWDYTFEQMQVDNSTDKLPIEDSLAMKARIIDLLQEAGRSAADLQRALGMTGGGWDKMWKRGTLTCGRLLALAEELKVPASTLLPSVHRGDSLKKKPGDRPYVEDRLETVERELRQVKNQLKKR